MFFSEKTCEIQLRGVTNLQDVLEGGFGVRPGVCGSLFMCGGRREAIAGSVAVPGHGLPHSISSQQGAASSAKHPKMLLKPQASCFAGSRKPGVHWQACNFELEEMLVAV